MTIGPARLRVEAPMGAPFDVELSSPEVVVGRANSVGVVVPDTSVSRQHARISRRDDGWWVEDLGATNGTRLNERLLKEPETLRVGDRLRLGDTVIHVVDDGRPPDAAPPPARGPEFTAAGVPTAGDRQEARLRTVNEVHRALAGAISLPELLGLILERCFDVLRPEEGVVMLREPSGELRVAASLRLTGSGEVFVPRRIVDEVAGKSKPALVLDAAADERFVGSDSIMLSGIRSVVAAPLVDADGVLGLITVCSRASVRQFSEDDLDMLVSLAGAAALRVRNVALAEEAAARKVLEHELSLAHDMQMAMLPRHLPEHPEVEVAAMLEPARSVGGDLYDFVLDGGRLWFIVADVAGKSVAAALLMAVVKALFRSNASGDAVLTHVVTRMNRELGRDNDKMMFVTAIIGYLELNTGDAVFVDAGHNPVLRLGPDHRLSQAPAAKCVALGVVEEYDFTETRLPLAAGETLVLYTDGVTDARNTAGEMFGADRLARAVESAARQPARVLVDEVAGAVQIFASGAAPEDDITLLALRYKGRA